jgi:hypothetical protein
VRALCPPDTTLFWHAGQVLIYAIDNADTSAIHVRYSIAMDRTWYPKLTGDAVLGAGERLQLLVSMADTATTPPLHDTLRVVTLDGAPLDACTNLATLMSRVLTVHAQADTDRVRITWELLDSTATGARVARIDADSAGYVGITTREAPGRLTFEDHDVQHGEIYRYGLVFGPIWRLEGQIGVTIPTPPPPPPPPQTEWGFALARVRPNPALAGRLAIATVELPDALPARLEVLDAAGRRTGDAQTITGPGRLEVPLAGLAHMRPGRYVLRLRHGRDARSRTLIVLP